MKKFLAKYLGIYKIREIKQDGERIFINGDFQNVYKLVKTEKYFLWIKYKTITR